MKKEITKQDWLDYIDALIEWVDLVYPGDVTSTADDEGSLPPPAPNPPPPGHT
jgi:hypothetical protein